MQLVVFFGHILHYTMHDHHTIGLDFLQVFSQTVGMVQIFQFQGSIIEFLKYKCNWHDLIVRQFLATVETDFNEEEIEWMIRKRQFKASFVEFCTAHKLDYNISTKSINIDNEESFKQLRRSTSAK